MFNTCQIRFHYSYTATEMRRWRIYFVLLVFVQMITRCQCAETSHLPGTNTGKTDEVPSSAASSKATPSSKPTRRGEPSDPPAVSSLIFNVVNNLGYDWYPLNKDGQLCKEDTLVGCKGGLACLVKKLSENKDIPLLSAGNTLNDSNSKHDFFQALKFEPAVKALNILVSSGLKALAMGSDVFRYGSSLASMFAENVTGIKMLACNLNSTAQPAKETFKPFVDIPEEPKDSSCSIRVIGFANAVKMNQLRPENITVYNEIDSIKSTIANNPRKKHLIVVMGEGTIDLGKEISQIEEVDLVIMSGSNNTEGEILQQVTANDRVKYILSKELLGFAKLTINVSTECRIVKDGAKADDEPYKELAPDQCKIDTTEQSTTINEAISAGVNKSKSYEKELSVKLVSKLSSNFCNARECTLGSTAADAVARAAAIENKDFPLDSRAVLLPAGIFKNNATLAGTVTQKALMDLLVDDVVFYKMNLTATQLKNILEKMVNASGVNFPQLSGFHLFVDLNGDDGKKVNILHVLRSHLIYENVRFSENDKEYWVVLPLNFLLRNGIDELDSYPYNVTGVFLSEALSSFFESQSSGSVFLPPPLGERINYVLPPTFGRCENLIAITVCYSFLAVITISSVLLLGYKIYSDRTAVHYVR